MLSLSTLMYYIFMPKYVWIIIVLLFPLVSAIEETDLQSRLFNPPELREGMVLSIQDCVSLAFKNSPKIKRKKYELDIAKGNVRLAQSKYFPVLSAGVGYNFERNSNDVYYNKKYRDLPNVSVSISKMIWDFSKTTSLIKMEQFYKIAAEYEFMDELCHALFEVKAKYYSLLKNIALADIAKENIELNERFLNIAKGELDKSTAQVYLSASNSKYIYSQGEVDIANINLSNSMYLNGSINYKVQNTDTFAKYNPNKKFTPIVFPFKEEDAVNIAYQNSPDLAVLTNTKAAMEQSLKYIKKQYFPELSAGVGYGFNHNNIASSNNSLKVGVNLSSDVNLMELKYSIDNAKSEVDIADNEINLFKKDLNFEVLRALANFDCYKKQMPKLEKEVATAQKSMDLAFKKYTDNTLDYTALHDAIEDYIFAKERYVKCLYEYNMSIIQTEMALHYHIVDIHHKAEHAMHHHADELLEHLNDALNCDKKENKNKKSKRNRK